MTRGRSLIPSTTRDPCIYLFWYLNKKFLASQDILTVCPCPYYRCVVLRTSLPPVRPYRPRAPPRDRFGPLKAYVLRLRVTSKESLFPQITFLFVCLLNFGP